MRILLVEDEESKRDQIVAVLQERFPEVAVTEAKSLNSGLRLVTQGTFDLVILDMTMPTFDISTDEEGGRPQAYGGRELLRHMKRRGMTVPVILLTQFDRFGKPPALRSIDEIDADLKREHGDVYRGAIRYNVAYDAWREELTVAVRAVKGRLQR